MNYLQLAQRLRRESGLAGTSLTSTIVGAIGDSQRLVDWIADAWRELQNEVHERRWRWLRAQCLGDIVSPTMAYTIDELLGVSAGATRFAFWVPQSRVYRPTVYLASTPGTEWHLTFMPYETFRQLFLIGQPAGGPPQCWSISPSNQLLIGPPPDQAYKVRADYYRAPQELASDTDTPEMPTQHHMVIVWKALVDYGSYDAGQEVIARARDNLDDTYMALLLSQAEAPEVAAPPLA